MAIHLTQHAGERMNQRGVSRDAIDVVCLAADRIIHLNSGVRVLSLSSSRAQSLRKVFGNALMCRAVAMGGLGSAFFTVTLVPRERTLTWCEVPHPYVRRTSRREYRSR